MSETGGLAIVFVLMMLLFGVAATAFWIWMLIDCVKHEPSEGNDKVVWVLVIALLNFLGAVIYFFVRKLPRNA